MIIDFLEFILDVFSGMVSIFQYTKLGVDDITFEHVLVGSLAITFFIKHFVSKLR